MRKRRRGSLYSILLLPVLLAVLPVGERLDKHGARLVGTVVDEATGKPMIKARVELPELAKSSATDGLGRFAITGVPLRNEPYEVMVRAFGYKTWTGEVRLKAAGTVKTEFRLRPLGY